MPIFALVLLVSWFAIVAGARGYIATQRTGVVGIQFRDRRGSPQWWSKVISVTGVVLAFAAPLADLAGLPPFAPLDHPTALFIGVALMILGITGTVAAQVAMGASWRGDVDPEARTELIRTGPYRLVRNPILTCTALSAFGYVLVVPNVVAVLMLAAIIVSMQIQVRLVEEPYLTRVHGDAYRRYAAETGRFLPGLGRLG